MNDFMNFMLNQVMCPCDEFERKKVDEPFAIIYDGGMTAVVWEDGSVTKTHCQSGDQFDPLFGLMACIIRKLTKNHGHGVDNYEDCMKEMAGKIHSVEDVTALIDYVMPLVDMLSVLEDSSELWLEQLGNRAVDPEPVKKNEEPFEAEVCATEEPVLNQDEVRQLIRQLRDEGEL